MQDILSFRMVNIARSLIALWILALPGASASAQQSAVPGGIAMVPMDQLGPQPRRVATKDYAELLRVGPEEKHRTLKHALATITDASPRERYAILVAAGTYRESRIALKPHVDL